MKANELRIGNYVKGIGHNIAWLVEGIEKDFIYTSDHWRLLSSFEGMPLTEEELINLGFIHAGNFHDCINYKLNGIDIWLYANNEIAFGKWDLKYVHQLQNLYFALTGEELTYNC